MENNEIYIDGVNVAGCEFHLKDEKYSCELSFINQEELCKCNDVQDCYYKQLKRLEQENKDLKVLLEVANQENIREGENTFNLVKFYRNENETLKDNINHLQAIIDDGRAENKRFREENKELKEQNETLNYQWHKQAEYSDEWAEIADEWTKAAEKYKAALEEIRVIADDTFKVCDDDCGNARKIKLIIDKINEVLS